VCAVALLVSRPRPRLGGAVLTFGCLALGLVVGYSGSLLRHVGDTRHGMNDEEWREHQRAELTIHHQTRLQVDYRATRDRLLAALVAEELTLPEAATQLAAHDRCQDPRWQRFVRQQFHGRPFEECVAAQLVREVLAERLADAGRVERLRTEFQTSYGRPVPQLAGDRKILPAPRHGYRG